MKELIPLIKARHLFASHPSMSTLRRWNYDGLLVNGVQVKLELVREGGGMFITQAAIEEFRRRLNDR